MPTLLLHTQASSAEPPEAAMHTLLLSTLSLFSTSITAADSSSYAPLLPLLRLVDAAAYAESAARRNSPEPARADVFGDVFSNVADNATVQLLRLLLQLAQAVQHSEAVLVVATLLRDDGAAVGTLRTCPSNVQVRLYTLLYSMCYTTSSSSTV
jgi:hypothetical protein